MPFKSKVATDLVPRTRRRSICADRRGATSVEYAIMLVFIVLAIGLAFRSIGGKMKRAGNETVQNFDGNAAAGGAGGGGAGGGDGTGKSGGGAGGKAGGKNNGKGGSGSGGSGDGTGTAANGDQAGGGGGGAAGAAGGGGGSNIEHNGSISDARQDEEESGPSYTRILAIVFMILFAITAFFAFRKGKSQAA
jgi:Flp pilus assembly pilin Flp